MKTFHLLYTHTHTERLPTTTSIYTQSLRELFGPFSPLSFHQQIISLLPFFPSPKQFGQLRDCVGVVGGGENQIKTQHKEKRVRSGRTDIAALCSGSVRRQLLSCVHHQVERCLYYSHTASCTGRVYIYIYDVGLCVCVCTVVQHVCVRVFMSSLSLSSFDPILCILQHFPTVALSDDLF